MEDSFIPTRLHLAHTLLPAPELSLAVHAHDMVELSAWLLASRRAALMIIPLHSADRDPAMPVMLWNEAGAPELALSAHFADPAYTFRSVLTALNRAADALLFALEPRWPGSTPPSGLGVVTDGFGLGFSPDDPDPRAPGWVRRQLRDQSLTLLLPFAPGGILSPPVKQRLA